MFSSRLTRHLERGVIGFPTTLASSVGVIMASPVILTVTSGFGMGGDTFALAVLLAFIMMQAQVTTFAEAATLIPTSGSVYDYIACGMGRFFAITGALCAYLIVHIFAGTAETILAGIMALVNFESLNAHLAAQQSSWMVGVGMVILFGLLNAIGVEIFGKAEVFLTFGMWFTLTVFGLCGVLMAPLTHLPGWFGSALNTDNLSDLFSYVGMAMFMFVGCELVTPAPPGSAPRLQIAAVSAAADYLQRRHRYRHYQHYAAGNGQAGGAGAVLHHAGPDRGLCPALEPLRAEGQRLYPAWSRSRSGQGHCRWRQPRCAPGGARCPAHPVSRRRCWPWSAGISAAGRRS